VDGDSVELLAELRPMGEAFTGTATHMAADGARWRPYSMYLDLDLPEVEIGRHYQLAWWIRDAYGADSNKIVQADIMRDR